MLAGVADRSIEKGPIDFWIEPRGFYEETRIPAYWNGTGIVCSLGNEKLANEIRSRAIPAVNVSWFGEHSHQIPKVTSDDVACGKMAANFFLSHGWSNFGLVGSPPAFGLSQQVEDSFCRTLQEAGFSVSRFDQDPDYGSLNLGDRESDMIVWLNELPKPAAILVWSTLIGQEIMRICHRMKLLVPDDVAMLAVKADPLISPLAPNPIAYIDQSPRKIGAEALDLLLRMLQGESPPESATLIPPSRIAEHASVDTAFVDDPLVKEAVCFIREKVASPLQVADVAAAVATSRRVLELRFDRSLQRSPADFIRTSKLARAKLLLAESTLSINEIAEQTGFLHQKTFHRFFKRETGVTPNEFRSNHGKSISS